MAWNTWKHIIEAGFDGGPENAERAKALIAFHPKCAAYERRLLALRAGVAAVARNESIGDDQFPAFMAGVREGIETPHPGRRGFWAALSLVTAALVAATAMGYILMGGPDPVGATEVEYVGTDLKDATVDWYNSSNGVVTIQVNMQGDDL